MEGLGLVVEQKFDIVDEPQQQAGEFKVQVGLVFLDKLCTWQGTDDFFQRLLRLNPRLAIANGRNGMVGILSLGGHAVGTRGTWKESLGSVVTGHG